MSAVVTSNLLILWVLVNLAAVCAVIWTSLSLRQARKGLTHTRIIRRRENRKANAWTVLLGMAALTGLALLNGAEVAG